MQPSEIQEDLKRRYRRQKMDKVWKWVKLVLILICIFFIAWGLIMDFTIKPDMAHAEMKIQEQKDYEQSYIDFQQRHPLIVYTK
jgi:uncharacterized protein YpmS